MLFSSYQYFIFFAIYFAAFRLLPSRYHLHLIVAGSLMFYGWWDPTLVWVPGLLCTMAYFGANWVEGTSETSARKYRLLGVVAALLVPLVVFKYAHFFFNEIVAPLIGLSSSELKLALPLGISFITFTMISYLVDVYRKRFAPEKSLLHIFAYTLFFPQLIAGPILRPSELIPQLLRNNGRRLSSIGLGLTIFTVGLIKKIVFADTIAAAIDPVFTNPAGYDIAMYWFAMLGFTVQIYCDFSGYTDMAIGSAVALGIKLPLNFNRPYVALSLQDFWRRWHMTLSKWLRDYLYIPLGGSRQSNWGHIAAIVVTMVLGGLWHGANWTFLLWGLLHGIAISMVHAIKFSTPLVKIVGAIPNPIKWLTTLAFLVLTWVFFRSADITTATTILSGAFSSATPIDMTALKTNVLPIILIVVFALVHCFDSLVNVRFAYRKTNKTALVMFIITVWLLAVAMSTGSSQKFIYFDF